MKNSHRLNLSCLDVLKQARRPLIIGAMLFAFSSCHNYTSQPLCTDANAVFPAGMSGTYTVSIQKEDFSIETQEFTIEPSEAGKLKIKSKDDEEESRLCEVRGIFIQESFDEKIQAYEQTRLYVTGIGLVTMPVIYDKPALDAAGIATKVIVIPDGVKEILGKEATAWLESLAESAVKLLADDETHGLLVDNIGRTPEEIVSFSQAIPGGLVFLRK